MAAPMQAVLYCRVSTQEQTKNQSIPTQLAGCRDYCQRHGLTVAKEFLEQGESAKTAERTQLKAMLEYCRQNKGKINALVVYNVSRFARDRYDHVVLRAQLHSLGVTLRSVCEPIDDSSIGQLLEGIVSTFAQFENNQKSERTTAGMKAALRIGRWTFVAPIGLVNSTGSPCMVPDPKKADLLRLAFRCVANGEEVPAVLKRMIALGLRGGRGRRLSLQSFRTLLRNPLYVGRIYVPKWGINVAGDFEPLIDEATFRQVQAQLRTPRKAPKNHVRDRAEFPLRRFLRCAKCEKPISGSWSTGRTNRYAYYHCPRCHAVRARRETVEQGFVSYLESLRPNADYLRLFREVVIQEWKNAVSDAEGVRQIKVGRLVELHSRRQKLEDAHIYKGSIDSDVYERHRDKLQEEIAFAELELHDSRIDEIDVKGILAFAERLILNLGNVWIEAPLSQRQEIQGALFPNGLPFDGKRFGTAVTCLMFSKLEGFGGHEMSFLRHR